MDMGVGHGGLVKLSPSWHECDEQHKLFQSCEGGRICQQGSSNNYPWWISNSDSPDTRWTRPSRKTTSSTWLSASMAVGWREDTRHCMELGVWWISSLAYGIGCVVDIITGLVIDFVVLSMYCHGCACASGRYSGRHTATFLQWKANHRDCNINYSGSSGGWRRKLLKHCGSVLSTTFDSGTRPCCLMTHNHLCSLNVWWNPNRERGVHHHVAKRLCTALRKLATESKKRGVTLGGRGSGELTQPVITNWTVY